MRILMVLFLAVIVLEGAIRKWILPEFANQVFILKDLTLAATFLAFALSGRARLPRSETILLWGLWALYAIGMVLLAGFSLQSMIGLRYYLAPLPLLLIVPALIRDVEDLDRIARWAVWVTFPIGALAVAQYYSPIDSPLNTYAWGNEDIATFGNEDDGYLSDAPPRVRVTATFSYISTYASFLSATWLLAWLALLRARNRLERLASGAAVLLIAVNMAMNGSRALVAVALLSCIPLAWKLLRTIGPIWGQIVVGVGSIAALSASVAVFEPFVLTAQRGDEAEVITRIRGMALTPIGTFQAIGWVGGGIGATFGGGEQLGVGPANEGFDEVHVDRMGLEGGYLGYTLVLLLKIVLVVQAFNVYRRLRGHALQPWALTALMVQLSSHWQIPFYNAVAAAYYFGAIGLMYWVDNQWRASRRRRAPPEVLAGLPPWRSPT